MGSKYYIARANVHNQGENLNVKRCFLCKNCNYIDFGSSVDTQQNCPSCGFPIIASQNIRNCIQFPDMEASSGEYIGSEEEKRKNKYYDVIVNYKEHASNINFYFV